MLTTNGMGSGSTWSTFNIRRTLRKDGTTGDKIMVGRVKSRTMGHRLQHRQGSGCLGLFSGTDSQRQVKQKIDD